MTHFPASGDPFPAGEETRFPASGDPFPAGEETRFRPAKTRLRPPSPGRTKSCRACWGTWPDVLLLSMTRFPASGDPFPAGEDPFLATASGPPARLPGPLGLLLRGEGVAFIAELVLRCGSPTAPPHRGRRPGRSGSCLSLQAGRPGLTCLGRGAPSSWIAGRVRARAWAWH
ncbi:hypothetical protein OIU74_026149 [Salix koriyanagi]|uniref:Uncharacterized protein n=1 Tax=Salix koriyanagi TaxID=2511006 RepID=A0A9Q0W2R1_9ROSI|nr:hypothetical protein OIU74_026149 [Salix koriyanagi]